MKSANGAAAMIDPNNKNTTSLPLGEAPAKRKRGRPSTGKALSRAEIQRQYRERRKGNVTDNSGMIEALRAEIEELKIALGKEVVARKKAEEKLITVTETERKDEVKFNVQMRKKGSKKRWATLTKGNGFNNEKQALECMKRLIEKEEREFPTEGWEYRVKGIV